MGSKSHKERIVWNTLNEPIAHYPNWAFYCPDCPTGSSYYELPQELPHIKEAYEDRRLTYKRPCGCFEGKQEQHIIRLWEVI